MLHLFPRPYTPPNLDPTNLSRERPSVLFLTNQNRRMLPDASMFPQGHELNLVTELIPFMAQSIVTSQVVWSNGVHRWEITSSRIVFEAMYSPDEQRAATTL